MPALAIGLFYETVNNLPIYSSATILSSPIEYLKGVGPAKAELLKKELGIYTFEDLLNHFPLRHVDRTVIHPIGGITEQSEYVQLAATISHIDMVGSMSNRRLVAVCNDGTGSIELCWFRSVAWIRRTLSVGTKYLIFGKVAFFNGQAQLTHPEMEVLYPSTNVRPGYLEPIYPSTEKLKAKGLNGKQIGKLMAILLALLTPQQMGETLPLPLLEQMGLVGRFEAYTQIHFPSNKATYNNALHRLKFEELFWAQLVLAQKRSEQHRHSIGVCFTSVGNYFNEFYNQYLPFQLTNAQKRVLKEIRTDTARGKQMNRLLQGDVGSGKTIVAILTMLIAADNQFQSCLMAPTEVLANQHFNTFTKLLSGLKISVRLLTGSTSAAHRRVLHSQLLSGEIHILIGTHALIEDAVQYKNLGLVVVDEQHRFGVAQRAKLWGKAKIPPHILVTTATPIPRTLAMTVYGDLDCSIMDELPPGRTPVLTLHRHESYRTKVMSFLKTEIDQRRQAYIVFPLIEESETLNYENLLDGYEHVKAFFPEHLYNISMVHGKQPPKQKAENMQRFVEGFTHIMVSTTVIEVGVDVPNATLMVIENAEKFGLSQLHQLRGRVGRGSQKSYCILLTGSNLSLYAKERMATMCATNDGFLIAEKDLELRGPGDIAGTKQSGLLQFKLANLVEDKELLNQAKTLAEELLTADPTLSSEANSPLKNVLEKQKEKKGWAKIS